ncbi:hypothetical protein NDU88_006159 [Pleurodeles waltl]|uniref:Uncharacterized protein n=1 Tax=Pleurodeles waltl TaxID=8319 RepID=A0AAV7TCK7_PLEWA|nr:hypothetical protein NDU88_006159 [Pleurodeles waltl]
MHGGRPQTYPGGRPSDCCSTPGLQGSVCPSVPDLAFLLIAVLFDGPSRPPTKLEHSGLTCGRPEVSGCPLCCRLLLTQTQRSGGPVSTPVPQTPRQNIFFRAPSDRPRACMTFAPFRGRPPSSAGAGRLLT